MSNPERTTSMGSVIGLGFIILGILNLFSLLKLNRTAIHVTSRWPGIIFVVTGIIIIIIQTTKKRRD